MLPCRASQARLRCQRLDRRPLPSKTKAAICCTAHREEWPCTVTSFGGINDRTAPSNQLASSSPRCLELAREPCSKSGRRQRLPVESFRRLVLNVSEMLAKSSSLPLRRLHVECAEDARLGIQRRRRSRKNSWDVCIAKATHSASSAL